MYKWCNDWYYHPRMGGRSSIKVVLDAIWQTDDAMRSDFERWTGLPADAAGIGVGATIVAVNSRAFTPTVLADALKSANARDGKLELLMRNADYYSTHPVVYRDGPRHPHLVRDEAKADWLTPILTPRTWTPKIQEKKEEKAAN